MNIVHILTLLSLILNLVLSDPIPASTLQLQDLNLIAYPLKCVLPCGPGQICISGKCVYLNLGCPYIPCKSN